MQYADVRKQFQGQSPEVDFFKDRRRYVLGRRALASRSQGRKFFFRSRAMEPLQKESIESSISSFSLVSGSDELSERATSATSKSASFSRALRNIWRNPIADIGFFSVALNSGARSAECFLGTPARKRRIA